LSNRSGSVDESYLKERSGEAEKVLIEQEVVLKLREIQQKYSRQCRNVGKPLK
jgi:hypothetical protein